jgi:glycosyltransferase involved in cell wall biosynthesis
MIDGLGIGGAESHLVSLLNVFDYSIYEVNLLMYRRNGALEKFVHRKVNILPIPGFFEKPPKIMGSKLRYIYSRFNFGTCRRFNNIRMKPLHHSQIFWKYYSNCFESLPQKYDFAIAFGQGFPCYYVADKIIASVKLLSINTDLNSEGYRADFDTKYFSKYTYILPVTKTLKNILIKSYESFIDKMEVFENTFDTDLMIRVAQSEKAFSDNFKGLRIVSVGRYVHAKGFDLAIKAAHIIKEHKIEFRWYLVGGGILQLELEELINLLGLKEQVILTGYQLNPYKYLNEADIYVQTSRYEGFCRTLREAKVFLLPIVTTNFSAVHEQIVDGKNGLIVEQDEYSIANGIEKIIENNALHKIFIKNIQQEPWSTNKEEFIKFEKFLVQNAAEKAFSYNSNI